MGENFDNLVEAYNSGKLFMARRKVGVGGGGCIIVNPAVSSFADVLSHLSLLDSGNYRSGNWQFSSMMPDEDLVLQGYAMNGPRGVVLEYSTTPGLTMREAHPSFTKVEGLRATMLLKEKLEPKDVDNLWWILDQYPTAVVEFTTYRYWIGSVPRSNTVIWEVRDY